MTSDETISLELERIRVELKNIAREREVAELPYERRALDETADYLRRQERRWLAQPAEDGVQVW